MYPGEGEGILIGGASAASAATVRSSKSKFAIYSYVRMYVQLAIKA